MMQCSDSVVSIDRVRLYAFHGVLPQERRVGGWFVVTLRVHYYNILRACETDEVADTLNYADLLTIVRREMAQSSRLLEHVAARMAQSVFDRYPEANAIDVSVTKENPPMGSAMAGAGIELHLINNKTKG
jgi:dihydroneopterin aldolase